MKYNEIIKELKRHSNPRNVEGMARFGINPKKTLGVPIPVLRKMAKKIGQDHSLAKQLWGSEIHEARILAGMIDDPSQVTEKQMWKWAGDFDSWDVCDQVCMNLFEKLPFAYESVAGLARDEREFVRRTGFSLMACLSWHDKDSPDSKFTRFFPIIRKHSTDERNFVKKAVNWALRNIGKKNQSLNKKAIKVAEEILKMDSKSARWIAADALRELKDAAVQKRLRKSRWGSK